MKKIALVLVAFTAIILSAMLVQGQQDSGLLAQMSSGAPRSYLEIGKPSFEVKLVSTEQTKVSWKVVVSDRGSRYHTLDIHIRFFDDKHAQVLEDTVRRVYVPVDEKVTVTHETITDASTASTIRTAEVSARQRGKAKSAKTTK